MRVLVIGDIIADVYRDCHFKKMCPDAPTVKAIVDSSVEVLPGGAANVALNLAALSPGTVVDLIGVTDASLAAVVKRKSGNRVVMDYCELVGAYGGDIRKERIFLEGEHLLRVDTQLRVNSFLAEMVEKNLRAYLASHDPDLVVFSDYGSGTVSQGSLDILMTMRERMLIDTKETDLSTFEGAMVIKLNAAEWTKVIETDHSPEQWVKALVVTGGEVSTHVIARMQTGPKTSKTHTIRIPAHHSVTAVDVCGCGDTFLAGLAASMLKVDDIFSAAQFANAAAATVVTVPRTAVADLERTLAMIGRY